MNFFVRIPSSLLLSAWLVAIASNSSVGAATPRRPNIVVILADDLGWSDLHCQGNPLLDTPHLDRLGKQGMRFTDPVNSVDTFSTLLEAAGLKPSSEELLDGENLLPLLRQSGTLQRKALFFHYPNYAFHQRNRPGGAIREGDFKLIRNYDDDSLELYNLAADLGETRNLSGTHPETTQRLKAKLESWLKSSGARMPAHVSRKP